MFNKTPQKNTSNFPPMQTAKFKIHQSKTPVIMNKIQKQLRLEVTNFKLNSHIRIRSYNNL